MCATSYQPRKLSQNRLAFVEANKTKQFADKYPNKWIAFHNGEVVAAHEM